MAKPPRISRDHSLTERRFATQPALVQKYFPLFECGLSHRCVECEGVITPSEGCATYRIKISYPRGGVPRVRVKDPQIMPSAEIHMYRDGSLCLYEPRENPWQSSNNLHETIIPWVAEWLVFYELFLLCGKWLGPEAPHVTASKHRR